MNVFLTVGSQLPMDRLVGAVEKVITHKSYISCIAPVGESKLELERMVAFNTLSEDKFIEYAKNSDLLISHAGMGNILLAEELQKPILVLARSAKFDESVNDHQKDTLLGLSSKHFIFQMESENDVEKGLHWFKSWKPKRIDVPERTQLINSLRRYILSA